MHSNAPWRHGYCVLNRCSPHIVGLLCIGEVGDAAHDHDRDILPRRSSGLEHARALHVDRENIRPVGKRLRGALAALDDFFSGSDRAEVDSGPSLPREFWLGLKNLFRRIWERSL